jgi:hypothetical protein
MKEDHIRITAVPREEPDIGLYVLALIALARQLQEEQDKQTQPQAGQPPLQPVRPEATA